MLLPCYEDKLFCNLKNTKHRLYTGCMTRLKECNQRIMTSVGNSLKSLLYQDLLVSSWQILTLSFYLTVINCHTKVTYPSNLEKCQKSPEDRSQSSVSINTLWNVELYAVFCFPEGIAGRETKVELWHWCKQEDSAWWQGTPWSHSLTQAMLGAGHGPCHLPSQHLQTCIPGPDQCYFSKHRKVLLQLLLLLLLFSNLTFEREKFLWLFISHSFPRSFVCVFLSRLQWWATSEKYRDIFI